jgi:hypothetical protein
MAKQKGRGHVRLNLNASTSSFKSNYHIASSDSNLLLPSMSTTTSPDGSPASIQPLHNPSQAAHVVVPQAPLGNVVNQVPGMGAKALFAKKLAKNLSATLSFMPLTHLLTSRSKSAIPRTIHRLTTS